MDGNWWKVEGKAAEAGFAGDRLTTAQGKHTGARYVNSPRGGNSGAGAMALAKYFGAAEIFLLGCDCTYSKEGKRHFFGDHPKGLGNAGSVDKFAAQYKKMAAMLFDVKIINCSRVTAIDCWPKMTIQEALCVE